MNYYPKTRTPKIRCAICNKPVDRVTMQSDFDMDATYIVAECHGDKDRMTITGHDLLEVKDLKEQLYRQEGIAFQHSRVLSVSSSAEEPHSIEKQGSAAANGGQQSSVSAQLTDQPGKEPKRPRNTIATAAHFRREP